MSSSLGSNLTESEVVDILTHLSMKLWGDERTAELDVPLRGAAHHVYVLLQHPLTPRDEEPYFSVTNPSAKGA